MHKKRHIALLGVIVGLVAPLAAFAAAPADYSNYWTLDEGTGRSANDTTGGQNGALIGTSTGFGWASGKVGTALGMDGTKGTGIALPNAFLKGTQGTISLWLNAQSLSDSNIIFSAKSVSDNNIYAALLVDKDGRPTLQYRDTTNAADRKAQGVKLLNKNEWYNLVLTANAQTYHIYVNGEEVNVAGDNLGRWFPDLTNQSLIYRIGILDASPLSGSWNGYLDDVKIFSRAITADEVKDMFTAGNAARPTVPAEIAPKVVMSVSDDHIPFGGSVALNWMSTNVDSCVLANDPSVTATSGSKVFIKISGDVTYKISCSNKYGTAESSVNVFIGTSTTPVVTHPISVVQLPVGTAPTAQAQTTYARNLTVGSRGDEVKQLQNFLISKGYLSGSATGYFGGLTKAAVVKLQQEYKLPATGFVGAMTRAKLSTAN